MDDEKGERPPRPRHWPNAQRHEAQQPGCPVPTLLQACALLLRRAYPFPLLASVAPERGPATYSPAGLRFG